MKTSHILFLLSFSLLALLFGGCELLLGSPSASDYPQPPANAGDLDMNGAPNELSDVHLFTNHLVGNGPFIIDSREQTRRTDVNGNGVPSELSDLVYMLRLRSGDAIPLKDLAHNEEVVNIRSSRDTTYVDREIGAVLYVLDGDREIDLLVPGVELVTTDASPNARSTRALVFSAVGKTIRPGPIVATDFVDVRSTEVVDFSGNMLWTIEKIDPSVLSELENFPNPFNPTTKIRFLLRRHLSYSVRIYNSNGSRVREFTGKAGPAVVIVEWDATGLSTGVYQFEVTAGGVTSKRQKMIYHK